MTTTIVLLGEPGSGKSTLIKALRDDWTQLTLELHPVKHTTYSTPYGPALELGWTREPFGGTDTLGQAAINTVAVWFRDNPPTGLVIAEGDRLANDRFIRLAQDAGPTLIFHLDTEPRLAQERRILRARAFSLSTQNPSWVTGRRTKHANLAERWNAIRIPGNLTPQAGADVIRYHLSQEAG